MLCSQTYLGVSVTCCCPPSRRKRRHRGSEQRKNGRRYEVRRKLHDGRCRSSSSKTGVTLKSRSGREGRCGVILSSQMTAAKVTSERARGVSRDDEGNNCATDGGQSQGCGPCWRGNCILPRRPRRSGCLPTALMSRPSRHVRTHHVLDIAGVIDGSSRAALATDGLRSRAQLLPLSGYTYAASAISSRLVDSRGQRTPRARGKADGSAP